jgi:ketosteroid isomerase-like protein
VEVVKRALAAWNEAWRRQDFELAPGLVHPDLVIDTSDNVFNPDLYRGAGGLDRLLRDSAEVWEDFRMEPEEWAVAGDDVVVTLHTHARGRGSGVEVEDRITQVWTVREGRVAAVKVFYSREEALREAGVES